ncbi:MAG: recombinase RecT [Bacteroidales bacterium]|jgi:recombinational DNA repair protein RecT
MEQKFNVNELEATEIPDHSYVKEKFVSTLTNLHRISPEDAQSIYEKEVIYYKKALAEPKSKLKACTKISLFSTFMEIAINNLSIQSGSKSEAYMESRGANMGTAQNASWVQIARFVITTYGELNLRIRAGQIVRMSNPIVFYKGDHFQPRTNDRGILVVDYVPAIPRQSKEIVGCWVAIHLPKDGLDFKWLLEDDIARLKEYSIPKSGDQESRRANALYSSNDNQIDPGFLETKTIKQAMRAYTKLRLSGSAVIETDFDEEDDENKDSNYSVRSGTQVEQRQTETVVIENKEDGGLF